MEDYSREKQPEKVKLVFGGDGGVGKTCLLTTHRTGEFPRDWVPTVFDNSVLPHLVPTADGITTVNLDLWDYASRGDVGESDRLRPFTYPNTDCHVLCFSVVGPASFASVKSVFSKELARHSPGVPVLLVGTKLDLRSDEPTLAYLKQKGFQKGLQKELVPITFEQGAELAKQLGYVAYRECSALTQEGVKDVFDTAMKVRRSRPSWLGLCSIARCAVAPRPGWWVVGVQCAGRTCYPPRPPESTLCGHHCAA